MGVGGTIFAFAFDLLNSPTHFMIDLADDLLSILLSIKVCETIKAFLVKLKVLFIVKGDFTNYPCCHDPNLQ